MDALIRVLFLAACVFLFIIMTAACRRRVAHKQRPSFWFAVALAVSVAILTLPVLYGMDLFTSRFWSDDRMAVLAAIAFGLNAVISLIALAGIVLFYRKTEE